jgi:hypothetical protein
MLPLKHSLDMSRQVCHYAQLKLVSICGSDRQWPQGDSRIAMLLLSLSDGKTARMDGLPFINLIKLNFIFLLRSVKRYRSNQSRQDRIYSKTFDEQCHLNEHWRLGNEA